MKVLIVEPHKNHMKRILKKFKVCKIVGGLIEPVYLDENTAIICNEEGIDRIRRK